MNSLFKSICALTLIGSTLCAAFTGCNSADGVTTTAATTELPQAQTRPYDELLAANTYAAAGETLMEETIDKYYNNRFHTVKTSLTDSSNAFVWPTTAFVEALAESYALYPDNTKIKQCYLNMLDKGFDVFKVTDATLKTPGGTFRGITYYNSSKGNKGDYYYDDNAWICVRYLTAYEQFGKEDYLNRAEEILEFLWTGYDDYQGGGIYWSKTYADNGKSNKGVCTNGPSAISYLWAYQITGNETYLERGKLLYDWVNKTLRDSKGIYFAGVNDPWQPAYDQGTMLYASCLLYEITGDEQYMDLAKTSVNAIGAHMFKTEGGRANQKVTMKRNPIFKSWCVGWLTRGVVKYCSIKGGKNGYMNLLQKVMDDTLKTKDANGQYDPFFCSSGTDFWDKDYHDHDVMQPAGIVIVLQLMAYHHVYQLGENV